MPGRPYVVAAIVAANRSTPAYGPGTAAGVAQRYLAAVIDGDHVATGTAQVDVDVAVPSGGPFGGEPWPVLDCGTGG